MLPFANVAITRRVNQPYIGIEIMKSQERLTVQTSTDLFIFIEGVDSADHHARQHAYFTEQAELALTALRSDYVDIQALSDKSKAKAGILPNSITRAVITRLWDSKLATMDQTGDITQKQQNHLDHWFKVVKAGILYGMPHTQSVKILQEGLVKQHDALVKKLAAEKAKAEKAEKDAVTAKEKSDKQAAAAKTAQARADFDAMIEAATRGKAAQAQAVEAQKEADHAKELLASTEKALEKIEQKIETTKKQAGRRSAAKKAVIEANAATVTDTAPAPDLSKATFSQSCKDKMAELLDGLESEFSEAELLCLAGLIRTRFTPSKA